MLELYYSLISREAKDGYHNVIQQLTKIIQVAHKNMSMTSAALQAEGLVEKYISSLFEDSTKTTKEIQRIFGSKLNNLEENNIQKIVKESVKLVLKEFDREDYAAIRKDIDRTKRWEREKHIKPFTTSTFKQKDEKDPKYLLPSGQIDYTKIEAERLIKWLAKNPKEALTKTEFDNIIELFDLNETMFAKRILNFFFEYSTLNFNKLFVEQELYDYLDKKKFLPRGQLEKYFEVK